MGRTVTAGRILACTGCGDEVEVFELGAQPWIEPSRFRCALCGDPRQRDHDRQLELVASDGEPVIRPRETPAYDPAQARIPF